MDYSSANQDNLFSDYENIPSESNPFCNYSENTKFSESYSKIIPAFFFRNKECSLRPSSYEKKKLRYFYNTTGLILASKLIIEAGACILFYIIMFMGAFTFTPSLSMYYSVLSDPAVQYSFRTIAVIISAFSVFNAGCLYTSVSPSELLKKPEKIRTCDIIVFFMAGLFTASVQNISDSFLSYFYDRSIVPGFNLSTDVHQISAAAVYLCIAAPVTEGIIFRGLVLKNLSRASQHFGILASSFLCALSAGRFSDMIPAFMLSVILSKLTVKHNSLIPSVMIHIALNVSTMIIGVYGAFSGEAETLITQIWTVITFITGGIFAVITVIRYPLPKINSRQRRRTFPVFISSVFIILSVILYLTASCAELIRFMYF